MENFSVKNNPAWNRYVECVAAEFEPHIQSSETCTTNCRTSLKNTNALAFTALVENVLHTVNKEDAWKKWENLTEGTKLSAPDRQDEFVILYTDGERRNFYGFLLFSSLEALDTFFLAVEAFVKD